MMNCLGRNSAGNPYMDNPQRIRGICKCFRLIPYEKLVELDLGPKVQTTISFRCDQSAENHIELRVENYHKVAEVCRILVTKLKIIVLDHWTIVEVWENKSLCRVLEDHESMLDVYYNTKYFMNSSDVVYYQLRQTISQYEFFKTPLMAMRGLNIVIEDEKFHSLGVEKYLEAMQTSDKHPTVFSCILFRQDGTWNKIYLLLRNGTLYMTKHERDLRIWQFHSDERQLCRKDNVTRGVSDEDLIHFIVLGHIDYFEIYYCKEDIDTSKASPSTLQYLPGDTTNFALRPSYSTKTKPSEKVLYRFNCESSNQRDAWVSAMRLAKYGKILRDNYRAYKEKHGTMRDYTTQDLPRVSAGSNILERESLRSRVAMDFTGKTGRIVDDPVEAMEIALGGGYKKKKCRIVSRRPINPGVDENQVDVGIHTTQPWFHSKLTRDQASALVTKYGSGGDGVFIVRPSRTSKGTFVLTYRCHGKLVHIQIVPMFDRETNATVYSMDSGRTRFYDLLQLVEFHTVNQGSLMCRLTHYVMENTNIKNPSKPSTSSAPEYVNTAVNTDLSLIEETSDAHPSSSCI